MAFDFPETRHKFQVQIYGQAFEAPVERKAHAIAKGHEVLWPHNCKHKLQPGHKRRVLNGFELLDRRRCYVQCLGVGGTFSR